jgi:hypothetical protein
MPSQEFESNDPNIAAVTATHTNGFGGPAAIIGNSEGRGVLGISGAGQGVWGQSTSSIGVAGVSTSENGVQGVSDTGAGVYGKSKSSFGVSADSESNTALLGKSKSGIGMLASTDTGEAAVRGDHHRGGFAGIFNGKVGVQLDLDVGGKIGVQRDLAVNGNIGVMGDLRLIGADVAEEFELLDEDDVEAGSVVILAGEDRVRLSHQPYDRRVAGVISGAGDYRPGIVLDRRGTARRRHLALLGKVWCKVDADLAPIEIGDLLTTSPTPGHAMRAIHPARAFGAVLGKALADRSAGRGLLPVLVTMQ